MAKLIFDSSRELVVDNIFEHPMQKQLTASKNYVIAEGEEFPDFSEFIGNPSFEVLKAETNGGAPIPIQKNYNRIVDLSTNYHEENQAYIVNIVIGG